jgi:hypothetical protein
MTEKQKLRVLREACEEALRSLQTVQGSERARDLLESALTQTEAEEPR